MLSYSFDKWAIASPCFYTANDDEPLCVVVLHKKYPKSFVSNFGGSSTRGIDMKLKVSRTTREVIAMLHR